MPHPSLQILLAIVLALAATYYWDPTTGLKPDSGTIARQRALPRTFLENMRNWAYNEQGALTTIVETDSAQRFEDGNESRMEAPRFYSHSGDDKTWSASAKRGVYHHDSGELTLSENVVLSHDQTGSRLETREMGIDVKEKIATSREPVTIIQGANRTRAGGMVARLDKEEILLMPNVESTYVRP